MHRFTRTDGIELYYKLDGRVKGPLNLSEIRSLECNSVVRSGTHVSRGPDGPWVLWSELRSGPEFSRTGGGSGSVCCVCGVEVPDDETVSFGARTTCGDCKALYVQRLQEGLAPTNDSGVQVWRLKKLVVMSHDAVLPHRCIKCNAPASNTVTKRLAWWNRWLIGLLLVNIFVFALAAVLAGKKVKIQVPLCESHFKRLTLGNRIGWGGSLSALAAMVFLVVPLGNVFEWVIGVLLLVLLICGVTGVMLTYTVAPKRITKKFIWLKGAGPEFLDSLSDFEPEKV